MTSGDNGLETQAREFAEELTTTVRAVAGQECSPFHARAMAGDEHDAFTIRQVPETGIPLTVRGLPLLTLTATYKCTWDHKGQFLAVDESAVKVYPGEQAQREPLFRYEFLRLPTGDIPGSHLQVHGHRDALTYVMTRSGTESRRGRARAKKSASGTEHPQMSDLHLPLGGHRFRPCLEDILQMLVSELGVDIQPGGLEVLQDGREKWRRSQTGAAVRDAPSVAIQTLQDLGYEVIPPRGRERPAERLERLRSL